MPIKSEMQNELITIIILLIIITTTTTTTTYKLLISANYTSRMALVSAAHMACVFGILGNIVSLLVFLAPVPTFYKIYKNKSTAGFQSIPYSVSLFSCMIYLYYAFLKNNAILLVTINSVGCAFEFVFLIIFMVFATKESKIFTTWLLILFNIGALGLIVGCTYFLSQGHKRVTIVGWVCAVFSVSVFAAPLSIMRQVIKTKSVEFLPLPLSVCLTFCAVMWFFYGILIEDYYIATPNVFGFAFGVAQMGLYFIYKETQHKAILPEIRLINVITRTKSPNHQAQAQAQAQESSTAKNEINILEAEASDGDGYGDGDGEAVQTAEAETDEITNV